MNRFVPRLLSASFLLCLLATGAAAASTKEASREIEAKVALESSLEKRLQSVLREALGSDNLLVIVNVTLRSEAAQEEPEVMPGVPLKQTQTADSMADASGKTSTMVSRISATIMVDQASEEKDLELVTKVATGILGISTTRGDTLNVERIKFQKPKAPPDALRYLGAAGTVLWLIFAVVSLILLQRKFLGPLITNLRDISTAALLRDRDSERTPSDETPKGDAESPEAKGAAAAASNGSRPDQPFSFIANSDLPKLIHILRHTSVADAATTIQYLPADIAAKVIAELEPEPRQQVISLLSKVTQLEAKQVRPMEESLRERIDFLIGGEDKLVELLDILPSAMQTNLLATLRTDNPDMALAVSRRLISIDDLSTLDSTEIKLLSRRVPAKLLAVLMKSSTALRENILPKLARGTREWLTQEIEFSQEPTAEVLESARRPVLAAISQLVREGRVVLRKKTAAPAEPPAPEPIAPVESFVSEFTAPAEPPVEEFVAPPPAASEPPAPESIAPVQSIAPEFAPLTAIAEQPVSDSLEPPPAFPRQGD